MPSHSDAAPLRVYMVPVCAEHGHKLGYGDRGERLCPEGCVNPRAEWLPLASITAIMKMLRDPSDELVLAMVRSEFDPHINGPNTVQRNQAVKDLGTIANEIERAVVHGR